VSADVYLYFFPADTPADVYTIPTYNGPGWCDRHAEFWHRVHDTTTGELCIGQGSGELDETPGSEYCPAAVWWTRRYTDDRPILTPALAKAITVAFNYPHTSSYEQIEYRQLTRADPYRYGRRRGRFFEAQRGGGVAKAREVKRELAAHIGDRVVPYVM
jgi:hypothetical protein